MTPLPRVGLGVDSHRFELGRRLILGGVDIPHEEGLAGHSDADVLTHAIIDALVGAVGIGDIGEHFPDTDERFKGANSIELLRTTMVFYARAGYTVGNVDATVMMEAPRLKPYKDEIRNRLAVALDIPRQNVNVKATTGERMGFVGRGEGVAAMAVVLVVPPDES